MATKSVENLPELRHKMSSVIDNDLNVQQDILETFVDRSQMRTLAQPSVMPNGKRIPGLKLDHPRLLALMHALVRFANVAADNTFTTAQLYPHTLDALGCQPKDYSLASLRYDLWKLRVKNLVEKIPHSRRYPTFCLRVTRSAWFFSSSSSESTLHSRPDYWRPFGMMPPCHNRNDPNSIASISAWSTIWTSSFKPWD